MAKAMRAKPTNMLVWILIGLLVLGLAGFGIGGFSSSVQAIGSVGDEEITVDDYLQALQSEINAFARFTGQRITPSEAITFGLQQRALQTLAFQAALDNEAAEVGISVGDQVVLDEIMRLPQFGGLDGNFNRDAYEFYLERNGLTAAEFDSAVRGARTRELLQLAVGGGIAPSGAFVDTLTDYTLTQRDLSWFRVGTDMLDGPAPVATDAELRDYHTENPAEFTTPEQRHVTYAWITPDMLADPESVTEQRLLELYESRAETYSQAERRDVDRLVFADRSAAESAKLRLEAGELSFDELLADLGIQLADIELGPVTRAELTAAAGDVVFSEEEFEIVGPAASALGPALFRINAILDAQLTSLDDVRAALAGEISEEDARVRISDHISEYEDLLAAGATIEELASETDMVRESMAFDSESSDGIAAYSGFRTAVLETAEGDFPTILELADGGLFAFRLDRISPPELQPFDTVQEQVREAWDEWQLGIRLAAKADELAAELMRGTELELLDVVPQQALGIDRRNSVREAPPGLVAAGFSGAVGDAIAFGEGVDRGVLLIENENPPDLETADVRAFIESVEQRYRAGAGSDAVGLFGEALQNQYGLVLDQTVLNAVHAQLN
ncbi:MAG: SurA N-terminal domain-containing protein [Rhodobacteraceae bacterium]|nr:SurA N-terminal domain-containing protein [Paracoccaceae bacterium]